MKTITKTKLALAIAALMATGGAMAQNVNSEAVTSAGSSGVTEMWVIFAALTAFYLAPAIIKGLRSMLKGS